MLEIRITAPELSEAINNLAKAMAGSSASEGIRAAATPTVPEEVTHPLVEEITNVLPTAPVLNPTIEAVPADVAERTYTLDELAVAGTSLIDAGKLADVMSILTRHGVEALTSLDPSQYVLVAAELRSLGAVI